MTPPALQFSHIGIFVTDLDTMRDFYTRQLGFAVTDEGRLGAGRLVFLSRDPREHHQLVLAEGRPADLAFNVVNQISLRAAGLEDLRTLYARLGADPRVSDMAAVTHGIAWSIYCRDPEGNRLELFADSPWYVEQPIRDPIDLAQPAATILAETEARYRDRPSFRPMADWRAEFAATLRAQSS